MLNLALSPVAMKFQVARVCRGSIAWAILGSQYGMSICSSLHVHLLWRGACACVTEQSAGSLLHHRVVRATAGTTSRAASVAVPVPRGFRPYCHRSSHDVHVARAFGNFR